MTLATLVQKARPSGHRSARDREVDEEGLVAALKGLPGEITEAERAQAVSVVNVLLRATRSARVRNASALALTDIAGKQAGPAIAAVLRRPEIARSAGTLLFALNDVEASLSLDLVVDMIERGSVEAKAEALTFMQEWRIEPADPVLLEAARVRLMELCQDDVEAKTAEAAELALNHLEDRVPGRASTT